MKKILIHTLFYKNYNYGGILQAYALYKQLTSLGYDCEELNYSQEIFSVLKKMFYRGFRVIDIIKNPIYYSSVRQKIRENNRKREYYIEKFGDPLKSAFDLFMKMEFHSTKIYYPDTIKNLPHYDYYIIGGDQVWNPEWTDINFFFGNVKDGKKIGYSCSVGKSNLTKTDRIKLLHLIRHIDIVSVREKNFSDILNGYGIKNQIVSDPVFLMDKNEWNTFLKHNNQLPDRYVFAYILGEDQERRCAIRKFADKNKLKIVSIPHVFRYYLDFDEDFADVKVRNAGPREFVSLIKNADFVVTDSFHGTAFSIILEKQFLSFGRFRPDDKMSLDIRLRNLLEEYDLEKRFVNISKLEPVDIKQLDAIDYRRLRERTMKKKADSLTFLQTALD